MQAGTSSGCVSRPLVLGLTSSGGGGVTGEEGLGAAGKGGGTGAGRGAEGGGDEGGRSPGFSWAPGSTSADPELTPRDSC
eukprot:6200491-Pyramimonas_sp.AAC.1